MLVFAHDYETTGVNTAKCGVVQAALCFATLHEDGRYSILEKDVQLLHPGEPIPAGASGVHGIYDHHVEDKPHWESYLAEQFELVNDTAIQAVLGYNSASFDDKLARRCGLAEFPSIDLMVATRRFKNAGFLPNAKLGTAYEGLTGRKAENAHDAFSDIVMTLDLIQPSIEKANCSSLSEFIAWMREPWATTSMEMPYGKHKGVKLCNLPKSYVRWALENMDNLSPDLQLGLEMVR